MGKTLEPSSPFPNGMSYELFCEIFCYRCKKGKINPNGFAEYPENGGCTIWDAMENARFDTKLFPCNDIVQIRENGKVEYWHVCKAFETDDANSMKKFNKLFEGTTKDGVNNGKEENQQ